MGELAHLPSQTVFRILHQISSKALLTTCFNEPKENPENAFILYDMPITQDSNIFSEKSIGQLGILFMNLLSENFINRNNKLPLRFKSKRISTSQRIKTTLLTTHENIANIQNLSLFNNTRAR